MGKTCGASSHHSAARAAPGQGEGRRARCGVPPAVRLKRNLGINHCPDDERGKFRPYKRPLLACRPASNFSNTLQRLSYFITVPVYNHRRDTAECGIYRPRRDATMPLDNVDDMVALLGSLNLQSLEPAFRTNGISGG